MQIQSQIIETRIKTCPTCKLTKRMTEFDLRYPVKLLRSGFYYRQSSCSACMKDMNNKNRIGNEEYKKRQRDRMRERYRKDQEYQEQHKAAMRELYRRNHDEAEA